MLRPLSRHGVAPGQSEWALFFWSGWSCVSDAPAGGAGGCDGRVIEIVRGPDDDIYLRNPGSGLPLAASTTTSRNPEAEPPATPSDDRAFRLARMPVAACR